MAAQASRLTTFDVSTTTQAFTLSSDVLHDN